MKTVSAGFLTMLQTSQTLVMADLYTITLASGVVLRYTSAQMPIVYSGNTFAAAFLDSAPGFSRGSTKTATGMQSDDLEVDIMFDASTLILAMTPGAFAHGGGFDNAAVRIDKALAPSFASPVVNGVVNLFTGIVAEVQVDDQKVRLSVSSGLRALNTSFPRNYFLPGCNHSLFDSGCALSKASYAVNGTVTSAVAPTNLAFTSNATQADGWFTQGYVVWTAGANTGLLSFVQGYLNANGAFTILYPLPAIPSVGDTFTAYPGCDKTQTTCTAKFNNLTHFRGYPFVPTPETLEMGSQGNAPVGGGQGYGAGVGSIGRGPGGSGGNFQEE